MDRLQTLRSGMVAAMRLCNHS